MLKKTLNDLQKSKIQGAEEIAKAGIRVIYNILKNSSSENKVLYRELLYAKQQLETAKSNEPCLKNTITLLFYNVKEDNLRPQIEKNIEKAKSHFRTFNKTLSKIGARKIKNGMNVFTHHNSNTVIEILKEAKKNRVNFGVKNTETRPFYEGRMIAIELDALKIPVEHFVDSAARLGIKESDIVLLGCDAITTKGEVVSNVGSEMFCEIAKKLNIPVYICTNSWKFDSQTVYSFNEDREKQNENEVWSKKPKGVKISNYSYENIHPDLITGIISEFGVYSVKNFIEEMKRYYPWMFSNGKKFF